jgi:HK97 gp10 family phage protein
MINITIQGVDGINASLTKIPIDIRQKFLVKAVRRAANDIAADAKELCPTDLGTLKDSIDVRIKTQVKGTDVIAIVGPKRGVRVPVRFVSRGKNKGKLKVAVPTLYAHHIEFGHKQGSGSVGPQPFMRPAWDTFGGVFAIDTITDSLANDIF